jgi:hypothetical protein
MNFFTKIFKKNEVPKTRESLSFADREQIKERWEKIEQLTKVGRPSAFREAVIEADKLVDFALKVCFPFRETAAERLKEAKEFFLRNRDYYENLWYAHKIRNEMVHTVGFELPSVEAKNILAYYKQALEIISGI